MRTRGFPANSTRPGWPLPKASGATEQDGCGNRHQRDRQIEDLRQEPDRAPGVYCLTMSLGSRGQLVAGISRISMILALLGASLACRKERSAVQTAASPPAPTAVAAEAGYATEVGDIRVQYESGSLPGQMAPKATVDIEINVKNVGTKTLSSKARLPVVFGYHWSDPDRRHDWQAVIWDDGQRGYLPRDLAPGETATIRMKVKAPGLPGPSYRLIVAPLLEGPGGGWTTDTPDVVTVAVR